MVRNFVSRQKLVQKISVTGFSWSERTHSGMVKQQELWTNLSVSICNLLLVAIYDLDETFGECLPDIPFGIVITIQNIICMINFKHKKDYIEKFEKLYQSSHSWERQIELKLSEIIFGKLVASLLCSVDISRHTQFSKARKYFPSKNCNCRVQSGNI